MAATGTSHHAERRAEARGHRHITWGGEQKNVRAHRDGTRGASRGTGAHRHITRAGEPKNGVDDE
jgi:hypothetical protein